MATPQDKIFDDAQLKEKPPNLSATPPASSGIVDSQSIPEAAPSSTSAAASPPPLPTVAPVTGEVDAEKETVAGQLGSLNAKDSKYIKLAEKDAMRESNNRGLINSTIAAGAGREAAIRASLPIAQQDAQTYTANRLNNQATENRFLENEQSTELNKNLAAFESTLQQAEMILDAELKTNFEKMLVDEKFSDEMKNQIVTTMNNVIRDSQAQVLQVGLSDRSAKAQAAAIQRINQNRDATIAMYENLLTTFGDWDWGMDFTIGPGGTKGVGSSNATLPAGSISNTTAPAPIPTVEPNPRPPPPPRRPPGFEGPR